MAGTVIFPRVRRLSDRRAREHRFLTDVAQRRGIIPAHSFTRPSYATGAPMRASLLAINIPASYVGGGGGGKRAAPDRILSYVWLFAKCLLSNIFFRRQFLLQTKLKIPWWPINILLRSETIAYRSLNRHKLCQEWTYVIFMEVILEIRRFFFFFFLRIESNF